MLPQELDRVGALWLRSLLGALEGLRPEQKPSLEEFEQHFRTRIAPHDELYVADDGEQPVAVLALKDDEVDQLYVDPPAQRRGIGTRLLEHAKASRPAGLRLVTLQRNRAARTLYERHCFVAYAQGTSPPPESEPDIWYRWDGAR